jgi:predicted nucleic acid-binding protein
MQLTGFKLFIESLGASGYTSVYIDSSSWNRLFDEPNQDKIRKEANAVNDIIKLIKHHQIRLIFSQALQEEMSRHPEISSNAMPMSKNFIPRNADVERRGVQLHNKGFGVYDALHIASAEAGGADVLITSDDGMIKKAKSVKVHVRLENPFNWLRASGLWTKAASLKSQ